MSETDPARKYQAPAKINLALEILGRRSDGYHELVSVMQTVSLWDTLTVSPSEHFEFSCSEPSLANDNLVERAAVALAEILGIPRSGSIHLEKRVPAGGGLGGGSSDAATALTALVQLWKMPIPTPELAAVAASLGSDVTFFLTGGTSLVEGRGERVQSLRNPSSGWYLLMNPGLHVSTARVFAALSSSEWSDGEQTRALARAINQGLALPDGPNSLEEALLLAYPEARAIIRAIREHVPHARLSGSGPTMFAEFAHHDNADAAEVAMQSLGYRTCLVQPFASVLGGRAELRSAEWSGL